MDRPEFQARLLEAAGGEWFDFEGLIRDIYVAILRPGDVCLDVGVNRGDHLFQMARAVAPSGKVIGFEAIPAMADQVRAVIANDYADIAQAFHIFNVAVADRVGEAEFFVPEEGNGIAGLSRRYVQALATVEPIIVPLRMIDDLVPQNLTPRFMKIDIEGAEYLALKGARRMLARARPTIAFEFDRHSPAYFGYTSADLLALFDDLGYRIHDFFGFDYPDAETLDSSVIWNFLAAPIGSPDVSTMVAVVRETMTRQGIVIPKH